MNTTTKVTLLFTGLIMIGCVAPEQQIEETPQPTYVEPKWDSEKYKDYLNKKTYRTMTFDGKTYYNTGKGVWESDPKPFEGELSYMNDMKDRPPLLRGLWVDAEEALEKRGEELTPENVEKEIQKLKIEKLMKWVIERRTRKGEPTDFESVKAEVKELLKNY